MASWIVNNELYSENVVWLIQVRIRMCRILKNKFLISRMKFYWTKFIKEQIYIYIYYIGWNGNSRCFACNHVTIISCLIFAYILIFKVYSICMKGALIVQFWQLSSSTLGLFCRRKTLNLVNIYLKLPQCNSFCLFSSHDCTMCTRKWELWRLFRTFLTISLFRYLRLQWIQIHILSCMFSWNRYAVSCF